ncbi:VanZ family protein [Cohaesibacter gelatinilyticus]|uniref:VanZ like family protein n=1 Tax=Cohaesibacter gelatinilyticus TaxID=372072 RepID=A0A285NER5_9HYPH|nr:VanZ family protein [Cohaesibacter gelatinilyticus]SNZ07383.1 VanZ like family protein [Cohaesibacter gelatinilyticus]
MAVVISGAVMGTANTGFHIPHPIDKAAHFIGFALFTFLFGRFFHAYVVAAILVLIAGTGVEVIQIFMPNRLFSIADIAANCSGAVFVLITRWILDGAGVSLAYFLPKRFEQSYRVNSVAAH